MIEEPFPDSELLAWHLLQGVGGLSADSIRTFLDTDWTAAQGTVVLVQRIGGSDDGVTDRPRLAVTVFGTKRSETRAIAEEIRQRMVGCSGEEVNGCLIDNAVTETAAAEVPPVTAGTRMLPAVYRWSLRRPY